MNDQQILDYLRSRAAVEPPIDLIGSIARVIGETPQRRRARFPSYLPAAVASAAAVLVLVLALIDRSPVQPASSASPSASVSAEISPTAASSPVVFVPAYDSFAEVVVESLPLHAEQDLGSPIVAEVVNATLDAGQVVYVTDRRAIPGWRRVEAGNLFAWAPLELDGQASFRAAQLACPIDKVDVASLAAMSPQERLSCLGNERIELRGWAQQFDDGSGVIGEPAWLAALPDIGLMSITLQIGGPMVPVHLDPTAGDFPLGEQVMVVGHFNDERSATCRRTELPGAASETPAESALWCAQQFVVTEVRRVGPAIPTPAPVSYRSQPGSAFTVIDNADADGLFGGVDTCTNPVGRFSVRFPATWYTNPTIGNLPACTWFAPTPFAVSGTAVVPNEVAIELRTFEGAFGFFSRPETTLWEPISLGGHDGIRYEQVGMDYPAGGFERLAPSYVYSADFGGASGNGPSLRAVTESQGASDYILNKAVLDRMMSSLLYLGGQ